MDTSGEQPSDVLLSAGLPRERAGHYTFVSSIHAFSDWGERPVNEDSLTCPCPADTPPGQPAGNHLKAGCERAVLERFGADRSLILNCGLLVGPYENVGRLLWWLDRMARGGKVLAPGDPDRAFQMVDARDFAAGRTPARMQVIRKAVRKIVRALGAVPCFAYDRRRSRGTADETTRNNPEAESLAACVESRCCLSSPPS
ncbi:hypothetical protein [Microbispora rosea]|uniref:hypothetical protein n=1 Tax=Microbispora rosea TaxID=58117 RepID=UPI0012DDA8F0|nr:hypothetical protein [Microbispora rosea]